MRLINAASFRKGGTDKFRRVVNATTVASTGATADHPNAVFFGTFSTNFYEKALFVKGDLATDCSVASASALPFALCFYPL
jgi:hypothetical protein